MMAPRYASRWKQALFSLLLVFNVLVVYSNYFNNDFQFDDTNAIPDNPAIRDHATIARAFVDPNLFSSVPEQRSYRPVTTASLALDYWIGGGLNVFFFHLSTFIWYSVLLVLLFLLCERLMDLADPHPANFWTALAAAAVFGLHPASAETVNYIIQRADLYNTLGCVAGLWLFIRFPAQRKFAWYLLPALLAMLAKPPALIFPLLLAAYLWFFELPDRPARDRWKRTLWGALPALVLAAAAAGLLFRMQPRTWNAGHVSAGPYRLTQPYVALFYFGSFFLPSDLNVDYGWNYLAPFSARALAGYVFVLGLLAVIAFTSRRRSTRPVAFGVVWFVVTLLPTSLLPLGDVANDHRMFFAFAGLTLAVVWTLRLALFGLTARLTRRHPLVYASVGGLAALLAVAGMATRARNREWLTVQSLWTDSLAKNPDNPRALNNFACEAFLQADYETALSHWQRAAALDNTSPVYQENAIRAANKLHRPDVAERYFKSLLALAPTNSGPYLLYAEWLMGAGRYDEALPLLDRARQLDPRSEQVRRLRNEFFRKRDATGRSAVFKALDSDQDLRLSSGELLAAPESLLALDRDGDGRLTAPELGIRPELMRSDPLLSALDANHDGQISASEIRDAGHRLSRLDRNGNSGLDALQLLPSYVTAAAAGILAELDRNHDGLIEAEEWDARWAELLSTADRNRDGVVTLEELSNEIFYRADHDRNGVVTKQEMKAFLSRGLPEPVSVPDRTGAGAPLKF